MNVHLKGESPFREQANVSEAKRNCGRVTDRGEEAWSKDVGPMNKNRIEASRRQGEQARNCEALVANVERRISGGRASTVDVLIWGDLASRPNGRRVLRSEESAEAVVAARKPVKKPEAFVVCEGPNERIG